ncbi:MAG TPA: carbohydrate-binding protein [Jatrophihabitans sp.]|nr:carbohydrate-binding protein [Jatrophihabitans sp.]
MRIIAKLTLAAAALAGLLVSGMTDAGAAPLTATPAAAASGFGATGPIYATSYDHQSGTGKGATPAGFTYVGWISNGDWIEFDNVNFFSTPLSHFMMSAAQWRTGTTELHLDSLNSAPVATLNGPMSGNNADYYAQYATLSSGITGYHTLFLKFNTTTGKDFLNVQWFQFS